MDKSKFEIMSGIKKRLRSISLILTTMVLFQSCRVYYKENVSLDKAVAEAKRVKLKTKDGQKLKFKRIVKDSNQYYGLKKFKRKNTYTLIDPSSIESLRLHNKTMSIIYGTGIGFIVALAGSVVLFITSWDGPDINFSPIQSPY